MIKQSTNIKIVDQELLLTKNTVKTQGLFSDNFRLAVLTSHALYIYESESEFLNKKPEKRRFSIEECEFGLKKLKIKVYEYKDRIKIQTIPTNTHKNNSNNSNIVDQSNSSFIDPSLSSLSKGTETENATQTGTKREKETKTNTGIHEVKEKNEYITNNAKPEDLSILKRILFNDEEIARTWYSIIEDIKQGLYLNESNEVNNTSNVDTRDVRPLMNNRVSSHLQVEATPLQRNLLIKDNNVYTITEATVEGGASIPSNNNKTKDNIINIVNQRNQFETTTSKNKERSLDLHDFSREGKSEREKTINSLSTNKIMEKIKNEQKECTISDSSIQIKKVKTSKKDKESLVINDTISVQDLSSRIEENPEKRFKNKDTSGNNINSDNNQKQPRQSQSKLYVTNESIYVTKSIPNIESKIIKKTNEKLGILKSKNPQQKTLQLNISKETQDILSTENNLFKKNKTASMSCTHYLTQNNIIKGMGKVTPKNNSERFFFDDTLLNSSAIAKRKRIEGKAINNFEEDLVEVSETHDSFMGLSLVGEETIKTRTNKSLLSKPSKLKGNLHIEDHKNTRNQSSNKNEEILSSQAFEENLRLSKNFNDTGDYLSTISKDEKESKLSKYSHDKSDLIAIKSLERITDIPHALDTNACMIKEGDYTKQIKKVESNKKTIETLDFNEGSFEFELNKTEKSKSSITTNSIISSNLTKSSNYETITSQFTYAISKIADENYRVSELIRKDCNGEEKESMSKGGISFSQSELQSQGNRKVNNFDNYKNYTTAAFLIREAFREIVNSEVKMKYKLRFVLKFMDNFHCFLSSNLCFEFEKTSQLAFQEKIYKLCIGDLLFYEKMFSTITNKLCEYHEMIGEEDKVGIIEISFGKVKESLNRIRIFLVKKLEKK